MCPNTTINTSVTCNLTSLSKDTDAIPQSQCLFSITTVVCYDIISNESDLYVVPLKGTVYKTAITLSITLLL